MYKLALEKQLELIFVRYYKSFALELGRGIVSAYRGAQTIRLDDLTDLLAQLNKLLAEFDITADRDALRERVEKTYFTTDEFARRDMVREFERLQKSGQVRLLPVNTTFLAAHPGIVANIAARSTAAYSMLEQLRADTQESLYNITRESFVNNEPLKKLKERLREQFQLDENKARFWARDQFGDVSADIFQSRQAEVGVTQFVWTTVGDGRVRDEHDFLNGMVFNWSEGVPEGTLGKPGASFPGQDYRCRCFPRPVFEEAPLQVATIEDIQEARAEFEEEPAAEEEEPAAEEEEPAAEEEEPAAEEEEEREDSKDRDYKKEYKEFHGTPEQKKNRAMRNAARKKKNLKKGDPREVDHKKPLSKGGSNSDSNLRVVSKKANRQKAAN